MLHPKLPDYDYSLVIRTDFSDDAAWERIVRLMQEPQTDDGFRARTTSSLPIWTFLILRIRSTATACSGDFRDHDRSFKIFTYNQPQS